MKKTYISLMALLSLGMVVTSCSNDDEGAVNSVQIAGTHIKTFNVSQEGSGAITRTAINGTKIEWQEGDQVTIWDGSAKQTGSISQIIASDKTQATIESPVADGAKKFTAVYPQSVGAAGCTITDDAITGLVIPATQKATPDSYDPAAAIMTAYLDQTDYGMDPLSRNDELAFKNVCAFLKLTTNKEYNSITVSTTSGAISGTFKVSNAGSAPALTVTSDAAADKTMTLNPASGTTIAAGTYYIAVAPATVAGLKIECVTAAGTDTYSSSTTSLARNTVYEVGTLGYGVSVDEPIINFGGIDGNKAIVTFTGLKTNDASLTVKPTASIATLSNDKVNSTDNTITVTAAGKGTANIALGDAQTSIEVTNFNAKIYDAETDGTEITDPTSTTVYLRVFDVSTLISDLSPVKYTVTGASLSTTSTPGVWKVTCGTGGYQAIALKVTYEYKGKTFTLINKTVPTP